MEAFKGKKRPSSEMHKQEPNNGVVLNNGKKTKGRVKIKMEFIDNKLRRYTTFSKRKTGIMKKAYELSTLTGTQVMLLVASETGHVYTFATKKLQPMITSDAGKALIQTCLNTPDEVVDGREEEGNQRMCAEGFEETEIVYEVENKEKGWPDGAENGADDLENYKDIPGSDEDVDLEDEVDESDKPKNLSMSNQRHLLDFARVSRPPDDEGLLKREPEREDALRMENLIAAASSGKSVFKTSSVQPKKSSAFSSPVVSLATPVTSTVVLPKTEPGSKIDSILLQAPAQLPADMIAQLGYTSLLAHASSQAAAHQFNHLPHPNTAVAGHHQSSSVVRFPYILPDVRSRDTLASVVSSSLSLDALSAAVSLSRDTLSAAAASISRDKSSTDPGSESSSDQFPENLSLNDKKT